jgi:hypothetical protein
MAFVGEKAEGEFNEYEMPDPNSLSEMASRAGQTHYRFMVTK